MRLGATYQPITLPSIYPDNVTGKRIEQYPEGYWGASTKQALELTLAPVITEDTHEVAIVERNGWPLDLVPIIQAKAPDCHITVFETEANRIEALKDSLKEVEHPENVDFVVASSKNDHDTFDAFTQSPETAQDVVVLYHITNHIPTGASDAILERVTDDHWLKPSGHVAWLGANDSNYPSFSYRTVKKTEEGKDRVGNARRETNAGSNGEGEDNFNHTLSSLDDHDPDILPTRLLTKNSVKTALKALNVKLSNWFVFHIDPHSPLKSITTTTGFLEQELKNNSRESSAYSKKWGDDFAAVGQKTASNPAKNVNLTA